MSRRAFFNSRVNTERPTYTDDTILGDVATYAVIHSTLHCCIHPLSGREQALHGREAATSTHVMYCEHADLAGSTPEEDWRVVATRNPSDGTFNVTNVRNPDHLDRFLVIELEELK